MDCFQLFMNMVQLIPGFATSVILLALDRWSSVGSLRKNCPSPRSKQTAARSHARSSQMYKSRLTVLLLFHFCFCLTVEAEIINPQCSKNVCVLPPNECVETCPRNRRGVYFTFGLRSNHKCVAPSTPGPGLRRRDNDTSADLLSIEGPSLNEADSDRPSELAERQVFWPEFGPPNCFWGLCQFEGPPCIMWCTEDRVYYGTNGFCHGRLAHAVVSPASRPSSLTGITVLTVVLMGMTSFSQAMA